MSKIQRFVDEIIQDRKLHPICQTCNHGKDRHAFDIFPIDNSVPETCWKSCIECFDNQTARLKAEGKLKE